MLRIRKLFVAFTLGLGLTLALVLGLSIVEGWLLGGGQLPVARAASFTVDILTDENDGECSTDCSLRDALIIANDNGEDDTITLGAGTHVLTVTGINDDSAATGDLDVTDVVTITGAGPGLTTIDASGIISDRILDVRPGAGTVVISGVTIMGGNVTGYGGGIVDYDADLTLINTIVSSNTATLNGGGIGIWSGSAVLSGGQVVSNTANNGGGVWINLGSGTLSGGQISNNSANVSGGVCSLALGSATLNEEQVISNTAGSRGGRCVHQFWQRDVERGTDRQ